MIQVKVKETRRGQNQVRRCIFVFLCVLVGCSQWIIQAHSQPTNDSWRESSGESIQVHSVQRQEREFILSELLCHKTKKKELQVVSIVSLVSYSCLIPIEINVCLVINVYQSVSYTGRDTQITREYPADTDTGKETTFTGNNEEDR